MHPVITRYFKAEKFLKCVINSYTRICYLRLVALQLQQLAAGAKYPGLGLVCSHVRQSALPIANILRHFCHSSLVAPLHSTLHIVLAPPSRLKEPSLSLE